MTTKNKNYEIMEVVEITEEQEKKIEIYGLDSLPVGVYLIAQDDWTCVYAKNNRNGDVLVIDGGFMWQTMTSFHQRLEELGYSMIPDSYCNSLVVELPFERKTAFRRINTLINKCKKEYSKS